MDQQQWQQKGKGHRQRLRDKFLAHGLAAFTDAEVVELLLAMGTPRKDTKEAARACLKKFGSLAGVCNASASELATIPGIGANNCFAIQFIHQVTNRVLGQQIENKQYCHSSKEVANYLRHSMQDLEREIFMVLFLDAGHAILACETLAEGTITSNTVYPREVVKKALAHNAAALVVAHNHPSGRTAPSEQDISLTRQLHTACRMMHISLLDHLIIGAGQQPYSFADHGIMDRLRQRDGFE